jgi:hypothetical protein
VFLFWRIGQQVNSEILNHQRAEYGRKIVSSLATQLSASYGRSFEARNLRRMMQFAEQFPDFGIVSPLATQLSWSHVIEVLSLKTPEARLFYLGEAATRQLGKRELRQLISRKTFERKEIANAQLTEASGIPLDTFKDPYQYLRVMVVAGLWPLISFVRPQQRATGKTLVLAILLSCLVISLMTPDDYLNFVALPFCSATIF